MKHRREGRGAAQQRGILAILGGTAGGQVIAFVCSPILARIYSPAEFGAYAIIAAFSATIGTVAALRLELAVPLPEDENDARSLALLGLTCAAITAVLTTLFVVGAGKSLANAFQHRELWPWLLFVGPIAGLTGCSLVLSQLAIRHRRYAGLGRRSLLQSMAAVGIQVTAGLAGLRNGGMLLGLGIGQAVGAISLLTGSGLHERGPGGATLIRRFVAVANTYRRFPLLLAPAGLINVLGLQLPVMVVAFAYGSEEAGWLTLTQRVLSLPVTLIGTAVAQVYFGELVALRRNDARYAVELFNRATKYLSMAAIPTAAAAFAFGPFAFRIVFGEEWTTSGTYARPLAIALAVQLVASPLSQTLIALKKPMVQLSWDGGRLLLVAAVAATCISLGASTLVMLWALSSALTVCYVASWFLSRHYLHSSATLSADSSEQSAAAAVSE